MSTYQVAHRFVSIDPALPEIEAWRARPSEKTVRADGIAPGAAAGVSVFRGDGQLGERRRHVDCRWSDQGYALGVGGVGELFVAADGRRIVSSQEKAGSSDGLAEAVLGPAVTLALALQDVWCLHAGAVEHGGEIIAFVGESGAGKSTLARQLPGLDPALRRAADDVLPVTLEDGASPWALPRFPQLKCRLDRQPGNSLPTRLPLRQIYVLDASSGPDGDWAAEPLEGYAAMLALVRHTVAAKLFTEDLLRRHAELCARLADAVGVVRLRYPHRPDAVARVLETIVSKSS